MSRDAYNLAKQYGISQSTTQNIQKKASQGIAMDTPTKEKQAVYNAYQKYYANEVTRKAKAGISLDSPNAWKNNLYAQVSANLSPNDEAYYNSNNIINRQENKSQDYLDSQNKLLQQNADAQIKSAESNYAKIRDQQISNLQAELDQAVADGKLSVQEAETQFEKQKEAIYAQNYLDSEYSKAQSQNRGIQNSQQFLGMEQTRQANTTSLLNSNMTDRDNKIFQINTRLSQLSGETLRGINQARTDYQYNVAGAQADIQAQMYQNQFGMNADEYNRIQNLQGQLDMAGMNQKFTQQNMGKQQEYTQQNMNLEQEHSLQQMSVQQKYTLQQFAVQHGYDLDKMSVQQRYTLAQMAQQYGYDLGLQTHRQNWQSKENSIDRNWQSNEAQKDRNWQTSERVGSQNFQANQNSLDRTHQTNMSKLNNQLQKDYDDYSYNKQLQREYNAYNVSTSKEYKLRQAQEKAGISSAQTQTMMNLLSDAQISGLTTRMNSLPTLSTKPTQKEIDAYNKQVRNINKYLNQIAPDMYSTFKIPEYGSNTSTTKKTNKSTSSTSTSNKYNTYYSNTPYASGNVNQMMSELYKNK